MKKTLAWNLQEKKGRYTISHSKGQTLVHFEWSAVRELDGADPGLIQTQIIAKKLVSGKAIQIKLWWVCGAGLEVGLWYSLAGCAVTSCSGETHWHCYN